MDNVTLKVNSEAEETENFNKAVELRQKIPKIKLQTSENEKRANNLQLKFEQLQQECMNLEIEAELQKKQADLNEANVAEQIKILQDEKEQLECIQQGAWKKTRDFINKVNGCTFSSGCGRNEALKILEKSAVEEANRSLKIENLKLEGEIYALETFKKFQEKRITGMENQIEMQQSRSDQEK